MCHCEPECDAEKSESESGEPAGPLDFHELEVAVIAGPMKMIHGIFLGVFFVLKSGSSDD